MRHFQLFVLSLVIVQQIRLPYSWTIVTKLEDTATGVVCYVSHNYLENEIRPPNEGSSIQCFKVEQKAATKEIK